MMGDRFPPAYFFIRSIYSNLVFDVAGDSREPGYDIVLWGRKSWPWSYNNQLWKYEEGYLINKASGLVLEIPDYEGEGEITLPISVQQNIQKGPSRSYNQLWAYNHEMLVPYYPNLGVTAKGGDFRGGNNVVVDVFRVDDPKMMSAFDSEP